MSGTITEKIAVLTIQGINVGFSMRLRYHWGIHETLEIKASVDNYGMVL